MAEIIFTIPDDKIIEYINILGEVYEYNNYVSSLPEGETPLSKADFIKNAIKREMQNKIFHYKRRAQIAELEDPEVDIS